MEMTASTRTVRAVLLCIVFSYIPAFAQTEDGKALTAVTRDLCHRQIVMLGESSTHGDGHTEVFKVALVKRLVNECGFTSVYFEASHYEFLHIAARLRAGETVTADEVSAAVGGLWRFDREFQPLALFLAAKAGLVSLGGIDDQLGQLGQDYANVAMVAELTGLLPLQRAQRCSLALHRRIYSDYTEAEPFAATNQLQIKACLAEVAGSIAAEKTPHPASREERQEMIAAAPRWIGRDFLTGPQQIVARDRSMFQNFEWLRRREPKRKVILWAATVHIARQADPSWGDRTGTNLGSFVHREYGTRAYSLGFAALAGSYRQGREVRLIPVPPPDSLEARVAHGSGPEPSSSTPTRRCRGRASWMGSWSSLRRGHRRVAGKRYVRTDGVVSSSP
jgi:erythromycin esterase-like protein